MLTCEASIQRKTCSQTDSWALTDHAILYLAPSAQWHQPLRLRPADLQTCSSSQTDNHNTRELSPAVASLAVCDALQNETVQLYETVHSLQHSPDMLPSAICC
jgi:hypothetical protein